MVSVDACAFGAATISVQTREDSSCGSAIFPGGNRQVSLEVAPPDKYCLPGELCLSRLSVCPIHFTSSVLVHLPFPYLSIEVGLRQPSVSKRKCFFNASVCTFDSSRGENPLAPEIESRETEFSMERNRNRVTWRIFSLGKRSNRLSFVERARSDALASL